MADCKRIAYTTGEPAGIGPDLILKLSGKASSHQIISIGCPRLLSDRAKQLGIACEIQTFDPRESRTPNSTGVIKVLPINTNTSVKTGKPNLKNSQYVLDILDNAIRGCRSGLFDAMVTGPVQKSIINDAGISFQGHTEYLANATGTSRVVMMLATEEMRVALLTTHLPLKDVPASVTKPALEETLRILDHDLKQYFGISQPVILVCGLNPHAGESGHLGSEEIDIISPVINTLNKNGMSLKGPLPADTLFTEKYLATADAVLAMYHDQGLPVLKYHGFGRAANITLGLPIIRTSVDHGTALDLAGRDAQHINTGSLETAITVALQMAGSRG